jgi:hypothetical protein
MDQQRHDGMPEFLSELPVGFWVVLAVAAVLLVMLILAALVVWHLRRNRQLLHLERIKAIDAGQTASFYPPDRSKQRYIHNTFWIAFWVGAVVPVAAVITAASATSSQGLALPLAVQITIWACVIPVCVAAMVCATIIMVSARRVASESPKPVLPSKPADSPGR